MAQTLTYRGSLVITSCWCGIQLAIPNDLYDYANRERVTVWCPLGHEFIYGSTVRNELEKAKAESAQLERRLSATRDLLHAEERSHTATRGHVTRKKKQLERVAAGVCPCCTRSFKDLARHMQTKHPEYVA